MKIDLQYIKSGNYYPGDNGGPSFCLSLRSWIGVDVDKLDPKPVETEEACQRATDELILDG